MTDAQLCDLMVKAFGAVPERRVVFEWVLGEWGAYATDKFGLVGDRQAHDESMAIEGFGPSSFFVGQITNYFSRAHLFGVGDEDPRPEGGRQAAMKTGTTIIDALASMVRVHGLPPAPGHASGEYEEWNRNDG